MNVFSDLVEAQLEIKSSGQSPAANKVGLISFKDTTAPIEVNDGTTVHKVLTDQNAISLIDINSENVDMQVAFLSEVTTTSNTFTGGAWTKRDLNTEVDPDGLVALSSGAFTLQAGTYLIEASAPAFAVNNHRIRLRNTTDSTDAGVGTSEYADQSNLVQTRSELKCKVTIAGAKTFELQHICLTTKSVNGLGNVGSFSGYADEVFATVKITKVGAN